MLLDFSRAACSMEHDGLRALNQVFIWCREAENFTETNIYSQYGKRSGYPKPF
jgi:hypothetical protein